MGIDNILRNVIKSTLSPLFETMKMDITFEACISETGKGVRTYAAPRNIRALVDFTGRGSHRTTKGGQIFIKMCSLQFLDVIGDTTPNVGQRRDNPIDTRDRLTLPDGSTAPVVDLGGFADSATGEPFAADVTLGAVIRGQ